MAKNIRIELRQLRSFPFPLLGAQHMIFTNIARKKGSPVSKFALALALVAGGALGVTALEAPAMAAKKKKEEKAPQLAISKEFVAAYQPAKDALDAEPADVAAMKAHIPTVLAAIQSEDERNAAGSLLLNIGEKSKDAALQLQGLEMMIASGKVPADRIGLYQFSAGQLAYQAENYSQARESFQRAIASGYSENDVEVFVAESYFAEDKIAEGLASLTQTIETRKAAGLPIKESWVRRGLAMAYNNKLMNEANKYSLMFVRDFPSDDSWGDSIAIMLNGGGYQNPEILDLLRLARRTGSFRDQRMYLDYIDAADYRRLPAEVVSIIDEGKAKGMVDMSNAFVADTRQQASQRAAQDQKDLPGLMKEGRAPGASLNSVLAAGDTLLSLGRAADAEEFYTKALGVAGVNTPMVLTRLGIAQVDQGKYTEAEASFNKVEGARQAIANLWSAYAAQKMAPAPAAPQSPMTE
ncbi:tetratricopeptide repeat protein [Qipengyuania marisflavi]|uniref:Tetratricopeptide repeat protein n=1 Tax=Qipengyuania marisflavi TaxID=2486356 RepID=A0A5S3PEE5_9SPHN|nr:tetratricopeptide repeat protein [Qipengyuania marisflavi]TMM49940.1 hypothetical protein FEV51_01710 [Qipengyuania marisflavi]